MFAYTPKKSPQTEAPSGRSGGPGTGRLPYLERYAPDWVACVWMPRLAIWLEQQRQPGLPAGPLVLLGTAEAEEGAPRGRRRGTGGTACAPMGSIVVRDASREAEAAGIRIGTLAATLERMCPTAVSLPWDAPYYHQCHLRMLQALDLVTPDIEPQPLEAFYLDLSGLPDLDPDTPEFALTVEGQVRAALRTLHSQGLPPLRVGLAPGKFTAWVAAQQAMAGRPLCITAEERMAALRDTPSSLLPVSQEMRRRLDLLGLRTLGRIEKLPRSAMLAQFGRQGERAHRLASGEDREPLEPYRPRAVIRETLEFPGHAPTVAHFMIALHSLLERLWNRPERGGAAVRQVRLEALMEAGTTWERIVTLRKPYEEWLPVLGELKRRLEGLLPTGALLSLSVELTGLAGRVDGQPVLFTSQRQLRRERLKDALDHLRYRQRLCGQPPVQRIVELDPWSFLPEERHALINFEL